MWRTRGHGKRVAAGAALLAAAALVAGCGLQRASFPIPEAAPGTVEHQEALEGVEVAVGSKEFTEQLVLGNMAAILFEVAGAEVTNNTGSAGSNATRQALETGAIDMYWEYTGTAWITYFGHSATDPIVRSRQKLWAAVRKEDAKNGLTWLPPAPMSNTYAFAIRREKAKELGVETMSDVAELPREELTFCVESEFATRQDGFEPMLKHYGIPLGSAVPRDNVKTLDLGIIYTATDRGECNFGEVFATDGRIQGLGLEVMEDDKNFLPLYNVAPVVRTELMQDHPEIKQIFADVSAELTNQAMLHLNNRVDTHGEDPSEVALDWLVEKGFVTESE